MTPVQFAMTVLFALPVAYAYFGIVHDTVVPHIPYSEGRT